MCCYSIDVSTYGALLPAAAGFEGSSLVRFHPFYDLSRYLEFDYQFKLSCCEEAGMCEEYTRLRPADNCNQYRPPRRAWTWGDPHITTLDGGVFTFNGWGEYTLMEFNTNTTQFLLQARTQPVNGSTATQLVAFAFAMITDMNVEFGIKDGSDTEMRVLVSGSDVTANVTNVNDTYTLPQLSVTRSSENTLVASFPNGIAVSTTASFGMLSLVLTVPEDFRNITRGVMGNFNGDKTDDVIFENGTMLELSVRDSVIHEVGQSWEIDSVDSLFTYPANMTAADFSNPDHVPVFLDEALANATPEIIAACNNNSECIFDYMATGNPDIAMETLNTNMENVNDQIQASNNPPMITGPAYITLDLGVNTTLMFNVSDDGDMFNVSVIDGEPDGSTLTYTQQDTYREYTFTWLLTETVNRGLMFESRDELGASAILDVQVRVCPCMNNGNCTIDGILNIDGPYIVLNCECDEAWEGSTCEIDINGCDEITCFQGVDCTDVQAPATGATCGPCPIGYFGDGEKCEDINECNGTHGCSDICNNLDGAFECLCNQGFQLGNDGKTCTNVDECSILNGGCHQTCTDTTGSFGCSCLLGYELNTDSITCTVLANAMCPVNNTCAQDCVLLNATETCSCDLGYELGEDGYACNDVNECTQLPCGQECNNTVGGFECYCRAGYQLISSTSQCEDINECVVAAMNSVELCTSSMVCNNLLGDNGRYSCICPPGTRLEDNMCLVPPPITEAPPTIPIEFEYNAVTTTIASLTVALFTPDVMDSLKMAVSDSVNAYCMENSCVNSRKRQSVMVTPSDVVIANARDVDGQLVVDIFVMIPSGALPGPILQNAIEENPDILRAANQNFVVMVELLISPTTEGPQSIGLTNEQIIGIAVGCVLGGLLILVLIFIAIVCCVRYRSSRMKSFNLHESYGLDYDNPVATTDELEPVDLQTRNESIAKPKFDESAHEPIASPNIYVNPGQLDEVPEIEIFTETIDDKSGDTMQSLILKFGDPDDVSQHSKDELTSL